MSDYDPACVHRVIAPSLEQLRDPCGAVGRVEIEADQVWVVVGMDPIVGRHEVSTTGIDSVRELLEWDEALPLVLSVPAGHGDRPVTGGTDRVEPRALITDRAVDIRIDEVLAGALECPSGLLELLEAPDVGDVDQRRRVDAVLGADPSERVGGIEGSLPGAETAREIRIEQRPVPGRADLVHDRLAASPDPDLLEVRRERFPRVLVPGGRELGVQAFEVEVLDVPADVGRAPRMVGRGAEHDAGCERRRDAASLVAGGAEVELDPGARLLDEQVRVVREEWFAGRRPVTGDHPLVRALAARRAGQPLEQVAHEAAGRGRRWMTAQRRDEAAGHLLTDLRGQMHAEELEVPVPGETPREHRPARGPRGVVVREFGRRVEQHVLDGRGGHRVDPCVDPFPEARDHRP